MSIYKNIPYTYRIKWSNTGMSYYGVRYAKDCDPEDLWVSYFTSSEHVREYIQIHGEPDIKEIRKTFTPGNAQGAMEWEHKVLTKINAVDRADYLNKSYAKGIPPMFGDKNPMNLPGVREKHKEAVSNPVKREKASTTAKEVWQRPGHRELQSSARKKAWKNNKVRKEQVGSKVSAYWKNNDSFRQEQRENRRKLWEDAVYREKLTLTRQGKNNGRYDSTLYVFEHTDGTIEVSSRYDLINKYKLNKGSMCGVVKQHGTMHKGWKCKGIQGS
jgi:hypothetical protein